MSEIQFYLINGLIGLLAAMAFFMFRSWYRALEHYYRMYSLSAEAEKRVGEFRTLTNSISNYDIEKLRNAIKEFGTTVNMAQAIEWFREQRQVDAKRIRELEDKVNFLWKNKEPGE